MHTLHYLLLKELWQMRRNPFVLRLALLMPVLYVLVFPLVTDMDIRHINLVVVNQDYSSLSTRLVGEVAASPYFNLKATATSYRQAVDLVEDGTADVILEIGRDFEQQVLQPMEGERKVHLSANAVNGSKGLMGISYLSEVVGTFVQNEYLRSGIEPPAPAVQIVPLYRYNRLLDYKKYMIPAVIIMLLVMLTAFLPAMNIVQEKETGSIEQINVTPISGRLYILAKVIPYWMMSVVVTAISLLSSWLFFGIVPAGSIVGIYGLVFISTFIFSNLGLIVSNICGTIRQAMFVMMFFVIFFFLLSGIFTPVFSMPMWAQYLTYINPTRFLMDAMRAIFIKGSSLLFLRKEVLILLGFGLAFSLIATFTYRKTH